MGDEICTILDANPEQIAQAHLGNVVRNELIILQIRAGDISVAGRETRVRLRVSAGKSGDGSCAYYGDSLE
jgi:hypothetical protein